MTLTIRPVLLESPYAGNVTRNEAYAEACMLDSLRRGEAPHLGHLLYTRVLDDRVPEERAIGIAAHLAWLQVVELVVLYVDFGVSAGMRAAIDATWVNEVPCVYRRFGADWVQAFEAGDTSLPPLATVTLGVDDVRRLLAT